MTQDLTAALDALNAEVVHVGQFDLASVFRERRLRRAQFLDWAQDPDRKSTRLNSSHRT